eukprot:3240991-Rhodomonas_salina.1
MSLCWWWFSFSFFSAVLFLFLFLFLLLTRAMVCRAGFGGGRQRGVASVPALCCLVRRFHARLQRQSPPSRPSCVLVMRLLACNFALLCLFFSGFVFLKHRDRGCLRC